MRMGANAPKMYMTSPGQKRTCVNQSKFKKLMGTTLRITQAQPQFNTYMCVLNHGYALLLPPRVA